MPGFGYHLPEPKVKIDPVEQKEALQALDDLVREELENSTGYFKLATRRQ